VDISYVLPFEGAPQAADSPGSMPEGTPGHVYRLRLAHLDLTPQPVQGPITRPRPLLLAFPGNGDAGPMTPHILPKGPTAIALIADEPPGPPLGATGAATFDCALCQQGDKHDSLMPLAWGEQPGQGLAIALRPQRDCGTEAALAAS
jgi:hypothetical protein